MEGTCTSEIRKECHATSVCYHQRRNDKVKDCNSNATAVSVHTHAHTHIYIHIYYLAIGNKVKGTGEEEGVEEQQ